MYYECHITIEDVKRRTLKTVVEELGWKFSAIDGDPSLGDKVFCYGTAHKSATMNPAVVIFEMKQVADAIKRQGFKVVRQKVELVMYDTKGKEN